LPPRWESSCLSVLLIPLAQVGGVQLRSRLDAEAQRYELAGRAGKWHGRPLGTLFTEEGHVRLGPLRALVAEALADSHAKTE
jgi:hypothetical protein